MGTKVFLSILLLAGSVAPAFSQTAQPTPRVETQRTVREQQAQQSDYDRLRRGAPSAAESRGVSGQRNFFPIKPRRSKEQQRRLLPSAEDLSRYAVFLRQPRTGLIRLMPDLDCQPSTNVVRVDEACLSYIPGSSFYSFREREYSLEALSDIRYKDGLLVSDGIFSQGFLVNLGDVAPEATTLTSDGIRFLAEYQPAVVDAEATRQYVQMTRGVRSGAFIYRKSLPVRENSTYALRVVAYKGRFVRVFRGYRFDLLASDARRDIIVVFRVVRMDADGGILLLWKELARKDAPKVIYSKKENKK